MRHYVLGLSNHIWDFKPFEQFSYTTSLIYGKKVFLITLEENNIDVLAETKANLIFFFFSDKIFNPVLLENALTF